MGTSRLAAVQGVIASHVLCDQVRADAYDEGYRLARLWIAGGQVVPMLQSGTSRPVMHQFQFIGGQRAEDELFQW